jgi:hypothetical protein
MNQEELLAERYGAKPRNKARDRKWIIAFAGIALIGFTIWAFTVTAANTGRPTGKLLSYNVISDAKIEVSVTAENRQNRDITCQVEALASDYEVVGYKEVSLTKSQDSQSAVLFTVKPAISAVVKDCWFK